MSSDFRYVDSTSQPDGDTASNPFPQIASIVKLPNAERRFLEAADCKWNTGGPTFDNWECVDGEWLIVTYAVNLELTPIATREPAQPVLPALVLTDLL